MDSIFSSLQTDLTINLGLIALVTSVVLWRISNTPELFRQIWLIHVFKTRIFLTRSLVQQQAILMSQQAFRLYAILNVIYLFVLTFKYIGVLDRLYHPDSAALDMAIIESLWYKARNISHDLRALSEVMSYMLLIDFSFAIILRSKFDRITKKDIPAYTHQYIVPRYWRCCLEGLWLDRIRHIKTESILPNGLKDRIDYMGQHVPWIADWTQWARVVAAYAGVVRQRTSHPMALAG